MQITGEFGNFIRPAGMAIRDEASRQQTGGEEGVEKALFIAFAIQFLAFECRLIDGSGLETSFDVIRDPEPGDGGRSWVVEEASACTGYSSGDLNLPRIRSK